MPGEGESPSPPTTTTPKARVPTSAPRTAAALRPGFLAFSRSAALDPGSSPRPLGSNLARVCEVKRSQYGEQKPAPGALTRSPPPPHLPCFHSAHHPGNGPWDGRRRLLPKAQHLSGTSASPLTSPSHKPSPLSLSEVAVRQAPLPQPSLSLDDLEISPTTTPEASLLQVEGVN